MKTLFYLFLLFFAGNSNLITCMFYIVAVTIFRLLMLSIPSYCRHVTQAVSWGFGVCISKDWAFLPINVTRPTLPPHPSPHGVSVYWGKFVWERVKGDFGQGIVHGKTGNPLKDQSPTPPREFCKEIEGGDRANAWEDREDWGIWVFSQLVWGRVEVWWGYVGGIKVSGIFRSECKGHAHTAQ